MSSDAVLRASEKERLYGSSLSKAGSGSGKVFPKKRISECHGDMGE